MRIQKLEIYKQLLHSSICNEEYECCCVLRDLINKTSENDFYELDEKELGYDWNFVDDIDI